MLAFGRLGGQRPPFVKGLGIRKPQVYTNLKECVWQAGEGSDLKIEKAAWEGPVPVPDQDGDVAAVAVRRGDVLCTVFIEVSDRN